MMDQIENQQVREKFNSYPAPIREKMLALRQLVLEVADAPLEETLKWGEPSYLCQQGSTVRMDAKPKQPEQYALYFNCKSKLVDTFRELYADRFHFDGNRAIIFQLNDTPDKVALKHCIFLSLNYHKLKHLPLLGA